MSAVCAPIPDPATWVWIANGAAPPPGYMVLAAEERSSYVAHALAEAAQAGEHLAAAVGRVVVRSFMAGLGRGALLELARRPAELRDFCREHGIEARDMHLTLHSLYREES